jgi:hypothetical protein
MNLPATPPDFVERPICRGRHPPKRKEFIMSKLPLSIAALGLATALGAHAEFAPKMPEVPARLLGDLDATADATRTIVIRPDTKYVNVVQGDVVRFVGDKGEFAVKFDGEADVPFDLERIAPSGALDHPVTVYVEPNDDLR